MSAWTGKFVIGLTGNIATGKSEVRQMLERLGALGIDADALVHLLLINGAPGFEPVVEAFGQHILNPQEQINRAALGAIVFSDPEQMARLESILHPIVIVTVDRMIGESEFEVIVVEAIKLIESGLMKSCDSLWVTSAPQPAQLQRLVQTRGLAEAAAQQRIDSQPPQREKISRADVVIDTAGSLEETWQQVQQHWRAALSAARAGSP